MRESNRIRNASSENGLTIKAIRMEMGLSQESFGNLIHIGKRTIQRWESGQNHCPDAIVMLAERIADEIRGSVKRD